MRFIAMTLMAFVFSLCGFMHLSAEAQTLVPEISAQKLSSVIAAEKGKVVCVNIFASWCPPCRDEVPGLIAVRKAFKPEELTIIGVSIDADTDASIPRQSKALHAFMKEMNMNYPVYLGDESFPQDARVRAVPCMLIFDRENNLLMNHVGFITEEELTKIIVEQLAK